MTRSHRLALELSLVLSAVLPGAAERPLRILVLDPLSLHLACACVPGHAQRRYDRLAAFCEQRLGRRVQMAYAEALPAPGGVPLDLVIGPFGVVRHDALRTQRRLRPLALLTDPNGDVTLRGLFVVRRNDRARRVEDLRGRRLVFGPPYADERYDAALAALEAFDLPRPEAIVTCEGDNIAALEVLEGRADAALISDYALPLLAGCGTVEPNELRVVGRTDPVPFVTVFAAEPLAAPVVARLRTALAAVGQDPALRAALESRDGFVPLDALGPEDAWTDWRGPQRDAHVAHLPPRLRKRPRVLWSRTLTGPGMAGVAVAAGRVLVADKSLDDRRDIWRSLDVDTGRAGWTLSYPAAGDMDFTNAPRACPVVDDGTVFLLGALGDLHAVDVATGRVLWRRHLARDFQAAVPTWGWSSTPLLVGDRLIVNPGAPDAALVALDRRTGAVRWQTPGDGAAYASFVLATLGGRRQLIGYDTVSLNGWDPNTGRRLWRLLPEVEGDFNVATPLVLGDRLLVSTENNGTRLYAFDDKGRIRPEPVARSEALAPDTATPVAWRGRILGSDGALVCLDLQRALATCWRSDADPFADYTSLLAGPRRVLATTQSAHLVLLDPGGSRLHVLDDLPLFPDLAATDRDIWAHPALVGGRLYVRNLLGVTCFLLDPGDGP